MIDYKLAEELKDAGFVFKEVDTKSSTLVGTLISSTGFTDGELIVFKDNSTIYFLPTLSELIEACGNNFRNVSLTTEPSKLWHTTGVNVPQPNEPRYVFSVFDGYTPEEAVVRLWLALNKQGK